MKRLAETVRGAAQVGMHLVLSPVLYRQRRRWGATDEEVARAQPGDALVPDPAWKFDHAIAIRAPRSAVWPWLLQGLGNGL